MPIKLIQKKGRIIAVFVSLLLAFGASAVIALLNQQYNDTTRHTKEEAEHNINFISKIVKRAYINKDFVQVETVLINWLEDNDDAIKVSAIAANGFKLINYEKENPTTHFQQVHKEIVDEDSRLLLTLSLTNDTDKYYTMFAATRDRFITGLIIFSSLLGMAFWYTMKHMVIAPLEDEVKHREDAESKLKDSNIELERRVKERTSELEGKTAHLQQLIDEREIISAQMKKLSSAVEQTEDVVVITDKQGKIEYVNPAYEKITGFSSDEVIGQRPSIVKSGMHDDEFYYRLWKTIKGGEPFSDVFINRRKSGSIYYAQTTITPLKDEQGSVTHYLATGKDITGRIKDQERLQFMATHDALTELPNRTMLKDRLGHAMNQAERNNTRVAVMFLDLDRFKNINDSLGHPTGDKLLQQCSERLGLCIRKGDTIARLGGDEFTIVMESINDIDSVSHVAQKINATLSEPFIVDGYEVFSSTSIGITIYPDDADNVDALLKNADTAMYRAKAQGGNSYEYYTEDMTRHAVKRLEMYNQLLHALEREEYVIYYQPRIDLRTGKVSGMEALLRWESAKFGLVMPDEFIPILEESDLIIDVGNWVIRKCCEFNQGLKNHGLDLVKVSVNLSARQFRDQATLQCIEELQDSCCSLADCLEIEITETLLMENIDMASNIINKMNSLGLSIAVDDFGTGYSSMSYLKRFPINSLKIDRSFIKDLPDDSDDVAITQAIIVLAHSLNLDVVAEGLETEEQLKFLHENKCDEIQGYLISHPLPEDEFVKWLSDHQKTRFVARSASK